MVPAMASLHHAHGILALAISREYTIGRSSDCDVPIRDDKSSRKHAKLSFEQGDWWVQDLDSANGTKVNGLALIMGKVKLKGNDVISIGQAQLRFSLEDPKDEPSRPSPTAVAEDDRSLVGQELGDLKLEHLVSRSCAGPLYKGWSAKRRQHLLVKVLDRRLLAHHDFADRFERDLTMAASIEHPAAVRILRCGRDKGVLWYSREEVDGEPIARRLLKGAMDAEAAVDICLDLGDAIMAYHERGLVHGDLEPYSACLGGKGLRLNDIGLIGMNQQEVRLLQGGSLSAHSHYCCPVQARTGQCNARGDIYSLGCLLYHMLMGHPPYSGHTHAEILEAHEQEPIPEIARVLRLPALLDEILAGMLQKDPFFRYNNMHSAIDALRDLKGQLAD
jgi:hypothetical protein